MHDFILEQILMNQMAIMAYILTDSSDDCKKMLKSAYKLSVALLPDSYAEW